MGYIVRMPKLGLEMEQGTILEWAIEEGEAVSEGGRIAEVESEKSIGEVEAREDGVLRRVYLEEEGTVPPGTPIGIVAAPDADISDLEAEAEADLAEGGPGAAVAEADGASGTAEGAPADATPTADDAAADATGGGDPGDVRASPRAEKRAEELGVDLSAVDGTGPGGAVTADDVEAAAERAEPSAGDDTADVKASPRAEKRAEELGVDLTAIEGSGPQGAITESDVEAAAESGPPEPVAGGAGTLREIPPGETFQYERTTAIAGQPAATGLFDTVEAVRSAFEGRVTMTDVLLVVASAALDDHPTLSGTYVEGTHQIREEHHVGLVTDVGEEPMQGVIADVGEKSVTDIVEAREAVAASTDNGDTRAPTFTLVNAAEVETGDLLIAEPAVAALDVDPTGQRAVPGDGGVDLQPLVAAGLTYDTRALDGHDAQRFLDGFFEYAQRAGELVLDTYRGRE